MLSNSIVRPQPPRTVAKAQPQPPSLVQQWAKSRQIRSQSSKLLHLLQKGTKPSSEDLLEVNELVDALAASEQPIKGIEAGQSLDPVTKRLVNYAEITGPSLHITATGSFSVEDAARNVYRAKVACGQLHVNDSVLPLPFIRGTGTFTIKYLDERLRIFENPGGALAVQVKRAGPRPKTR